MPTNINDGVVRDEACKPIQEVIPAPQAPAVILPFDPGILAGQAAASSIGAYRRDVAHYLRFAQTSEAALQPETLARWRNALAQERKLSPNTITRRLSAVRRLMDEAAQQGFIAAEVAARFKQVRGVKIKALKKQLKKDARVRIESSEMRRVCELPDRGTRKGCRDAALLATLASSGLRVSEAAELRRDQIVERGHGLFVSIMGKNDEEPRDAPLSREAYHLITEWMALRGVESPYLFLAWDGRGDERITDRPMSIQAVWQTVRKYTVEGGLVGVKPHDFRRFVGTQLAKKDIRKAQKALGHKDIRVTATHYVLDELEGGLTDALY